MPDPTTPAKNLVLPTVGADNDVWGGYLVNDLSMIDEALGGTVTITISGNTVLNATQIQNSGYEFVGSLSGAATITWPSFKGFAAIQNATGGGQSISCGISGGTFVTVANGAIMPIWSDGTNFLLLAQVVGNGETTGSGAVVLQDGPTIESPTFTGTISGLAAIATSGSASDLVAGTVPNARLSNVPNSALAHSSITIAGHTVSLGGSQTLAASDLTNGVDGSGAVVLQTSPAFAGVPTAPTAGVGGNGTQLATTAFVQENQLGINVKVFGATGNGSTDDSGAINSAISSLGAQGGIIYFPPGTYSITSPIIIQNNVLLVGSGRGATVIRAGAANLNLVETANFATWLGTNTTEGIYKWGLFHLSINGGSSVCASCNGLSVYGFDYNIVDCEIYSCGGYGFYSEWSTSSTVPTIDGDSMEAHIQGLKVWGNTQQGIIWRGPHDSNFDDIQVFLNGAQGFYLDNASNYSGNGATFTNFHAYANSGWGFYCNALCFATNFESESNENSGIYITDTYYSGFCGNNVIVYNNSGDGLTLAAGSATISGIQAYNNAGNGITTNAQATIDNVQSYSNTGSGVVVNGGTGTFSNVRSFSNGQNGVVINVSAVFNSAFVYSNGAHGISISSNDVTVTGFEALQNTFWGVILANNLAGIQLFGHSISNSSGQIDLGESLQPPCIVDCSAYNEGGQTAVGGNGDANIFMRIAVAGPGGGSPINQAQTG